MEVRKSGEKTSRTYKNHHSLNTANLSSTAQEKQLLASGAVRLLEMGVSDIYHFKSRFVKEGKKIPEIK